MGWFFFRVLAKTIKVLAQKKQILLILPEISLIDYSDFSLLLGFLLGFGAILGDLVKSYFKRNTVLMRIKIPFYLLKNNIKNTQIKPKINNYQPLPPVLYPIAWQHF